MSATTAQRATSATGTAPTLPVSAGTTPGISATATAAANASTLSFGQAGDEPLPGDWDGDGDDNPGVVRGNIFLLRMTNSSGNADRIVIFGVTTDLVAKGRFINTTTRDGLAVGRYNVA